jgi:hypothetical protein
MLGVAAFHGVMAVVLVGVKTSEDPRARLQNGGWALKLLAYAGLIVVMFWLSAARFEAVTIGQYPIVTPVRRELEINRTYGLSVFEFYF